MCIHPYIEDPVYQGLSIQWWCGPYLHAFLTCTTSSVSYMYPMAVTCYSVAMQSCLQFGFLQPIRKPLIPNKLFLVYYR